MTLRDLARKDVIRLSNGENLGRIDDIEFEEKSARLTAVVLHGRSRCLGLLGSDDDLVIPWQSIKTIGTDAVMVEPDPDADLPPIKSYNLCKTCEIQVQLSVQYAIINKTTVPWGKMYAKTAV